MLSKVNLILSVIFACQLCLVNCQGDLVFLIDDTGSMHDDIAQVKTEVDKLFDAAFTSNSSIIEEFLIVTFNDPAVRLRTKTKDRDVFKKALNEITVHGGDDCPEMALTGLELALNESRPNSLVYLFTDADAKDFQKKETVKTMAKEKKSRLLFMLTGTCRDAADNRTYLDLAEATDGQVFSLFKKEVGQMLAHARETVSGGYVRRVAAFSAAPVRRLAYSSAVVNDAIPTEQVQATNFTIDESTKDALVSVSGHALEVRVLGPDGAAPNTENVAETSGSKVLKIVDAKPGAYTITVKSYGPSSVVINQKHS